MTETAVGIHILQILPLWKIIPLQDLSRKDGDGDVTGIQMFIQRGDSANPNASSRPLKSRHGNLLPTRALRTTGKVFSVLDGKGK